MKPGTRIMASLLLGALLPVLACHQKAESQPAAARFASKPIASAIAPGVIDEASGIADSKKNPGYLWVEQDSGNPSDIFLLSASGKIMKKITIKPAVNRDWEDMAVANGPVNGQNYIYLADIGDNNSSRTRYFFYRFEEPASSVDTVFNADKITFTYEDGPRDAEAFLVDNISKDIFIISKRDSVSRIYRLPYPQSTTGINTATYVSSLGFNGIVSAALSPAGDEIVVKTYFGIMYWKRTAAQTLPAALAKTPAQLNYEFEPQGEAICFANDRSGFYCLGERPSFFPSVNLNFYKRL